MTVFRLCALLLSTVACLLCHTSASEPACSRFYYEERLLEKMVRLEHDFRLLQDKWQAAQEALTQSMAKADIMIVQMQTVSDASKMRIDAYNATMDGLVANFMARADKQLAEQHETATSLLNHFRAITFKKSSCANILYILIYLTFVLHIHFCSH